MDDRVIWPPFRKCRKQKQKKIHVQVDFVFAPALPPATRPILYNITCYYTYYWNTD